MKQFVALAVLAFVACATAMPRYLVIPLEDVEFVDGPAPVHHRLVRRSAQQEEAEAAAYRQPQKAQPRQDLGVDAPRASGSFFDAIKAAKITTAEDSLASGSTSYHSPPQGSDYVDFGAYTGKHGAFGWYSDHPVLLGYGHH